MGNDPDGAEKLMQAVQAVGLLLEGITQAESRDEHRARESAIMDMIEDLVNVHANLVEIFRNLRSSRVPRQRGR